MDLDSGGTYRPKTRETQAAYETLLSLVQEKLGDYATDVIAGAADEILGILKSSHLKVRIARFFCLSMGHKIAKHKPRLPDGFFGMFCRAY